MGGPESEKFPEVKIIDGKRYRQVDTGYTLREWFSHDTTEKGPGPGWDSRMQLLDDKNALEKYGRTFNEDEVFNPNRLPDTPYYSWELLEE